MSVTRKTKESEREYLERGDKIEILQRTLQFAKIKVFNGGRMGWDIRGEEEENVVNKTCLKTSNISRAKK